MPFDVVAHPARIDARLASRPYPRLTPMAAWGCIEIFSVCLRIQQGSHPQSRLANESFRAYVAEPAAVPRKRTKLFSMAQRLPVIALEQFRLRPRKEKHDGDQENDP